MWTTEFAICKIFTIFCLQFYILHNLASPRCLILFTRELHHHIWNADEKTTPAWRLWFKAQWNMFIFSRSWFRLSLFLCGGLDPRGRRFNFLEMRSPIRRRVRLLMLAFLVKTQFWRDHPYRKLWTSMLMLLMRRRSSRSSFQPSAPPQSDMDQILPTTQPDRNRSNSNRFRLKSLKGNVKFIKFTTMGRERRPVVPARRWDGYYRCPDGMGGSLKNVDDYITLLMVLIGLWNCEWPQ